MGFWRRLALKEWERAVKMRSSRADLERTEEDLTTHMQKKIFSVNARESFFPCFASEENFTKNWGEKIQ